MRRDPRSPTEGEDSNDGSAVALDGGPLPGPPITAGWREPSPSPQDAGSVAWVLDQTAGTLRTLPSVPELLIGADNAQMPRHSPPRSERRDWRAGCRAAP